MKTYDLDEQGKPKASLNNISKMNIFEYLYYFGSPAGIDYTMFFESVVRTIIVPLATLFYPVLSLYGAYREIRTAKKYKGE